MHASARMHPTQCLQGLRAGVIRASAGASDGGERYRAARYQSRSAHAGTVTGAPCSLARATVPA